jgi:altronate hydrolase
LARRKPAWIDFDASVVLGAGGFEAAAVSLCDLVCATASGQPARNEINGEREMAIWKSGVTL